MAGLDSLMSFVCNLVAKDLLSGQLERFMMIQEGMRIQMFNGSTMPVIIEAEQYQIISGVTGGDMRIQLS